MLRMIFLIISILKMIILSALFKESSLHEWTSRGGVVGSARGRTHMGSLQGNRSVLTFGNPCGVRRFWTSEVLMVA